MLNYTKPQILTSITATPAIMGSGKTGGANDSAHMPSTAAYEADE
jgi:hypothetical protein